MTPRCSTGSKRPGWVFPPWHAEEDILATRLQKYLKGQKRLLLLDDASDPACGQRLMLADKKTSLTVIATSQGQVARQLAANADCILCIPGFSPSETSLFYERVWGSLPKEAAGYIRSAVDLFWGHPAAMNSIFHLAQRLGGETLLQLLTSSDRLPISLAEEIYAPLKAPFERLPDETQKQYRKIADLPITPVYSAGAFADLWNLPAAQVLYILDTLMTNAGVVRPAPKTSGHWEVHPQLRSFVRSLLVEGKSCRDNPQGKGN